MPHHKLPEIAFARKLRREMTDAERKLWHALRGHRFQGLHFRRQVPCGPYIADFLCHAAKLVVEIDGATHSTDAELRRDSLRDVWFANNGFSVLRVTNAEVYAEFEGVLETIYWRAEENLPPPQPSPASREREQPPAFIGAADRERPLSHEVGERQGGGLTK